VPKCIVHGAGGTLLQHVKEHRLHSDVRPGDRVLPVEAQPYCNCFNPHPAAAIPEGAQVLAVPDGLRFSGPRMVVALSAGLGKEGFTADSIETSAAVRLEKVGEGFAITHSDLICIAKVPNISEGKFAEIAEITKSGCPVSKVLNAKISLVAKLS
jgi:hypothetical protein